MVCHKRDMPEIPNAIVAGCSTRPGRRDEGWSKGEIGRPPCGAGWIAPFSSPLVFTETAVAVASIGGSGIPYAVQVSDTVTNQPS
jgi:hypothetical protein